MASKDTVLYFQTFRRSLGNSSRNRVHQQCSEISDARVRGKGRTLRVRARWRETQIIARLRAKGDDDRRCSWSTHHRGATGDRHGSLTAEGMLTRREANLLDDLCMPSEWLRRWKSKLRKRDGVELPSSTDTLCDRAGGDCTAACGSGGT
eukprot:3388647-Pleurochrysis_carterae.AAC.2